MIDARWEVAADVPADADIVCEFAWEGTLDALSVPESVARVNGFRAAVGDTLRASDGARAVVVVGLGSVTDADTRTLVAAAGDLGRSLRHATVAAVRVLDPAHTASVVHGLVLGAYRFDRHHSDPAPSHLERVVLIGADPAVVESRSAPALRQRHAPGSDLPGWCPPACAGARPARASTGLVDRARRQPGGIWRGRRPRRCCSHRRSVG